MAAAAAAAGSRRRRWRRPERRATPRPRKRNEEWGTGDKNLSLPQLRNAGPCPYVKVLYDAARYVELADHQPAASAVGFTW